VPRRNDPSIAEDLKPLKTKHDARSPGVTYQLEHVLCGKPKCRKLHGPYWYAYWKRDNRVRKQYIGKKFHIIDGRLLDWHWLPGKEPGSGVLGNPSSATRKRLPKTRRQSQPPPKKEQIRARQTRPVP
jgi:hypothetical protein